MQKVKIKKNDEVVVIHGRDRGARGKVLKIYPSAGTAIVERINMIKRHTRANPQKSVQGGILEREAPIRLSNLQLVCPECGKPTRVGRARLENGAGIRSCKACGATFS